MKKCDVIDINIGIMNQTYFENEDNWLKLFKEAFQEEGFNVVYSTDFFNIIMELGIVDCFENMVKLEFIEDVANPEELEEGLSSISFILGSRTFRLSLFTPSELVGLAFVDGRQFLGC